MTPSTGTSDSSCLNAVPRSIPARAARQADVDQRHEDSRQPSFVPQPPPSALNKSIRVEPSFCVESASAARASVRSEEHTSELQSLMRISYAVFCLKKKKLANMKQAPRN